MRQGDFAIAGRTYPALRLRDTTGTASIRDGALRSAIGRGLKSSIADGRRQARFGRARGRNTGRSARERRHLVRLERRGPGRGPVRAGDRQPMGRSPSRPWICRNGILTNTTSAMPTVCSGLYFIFAARWFNFRGAISPAICASIGCLRALWRRCCRRRISSGSMTTI